MRLHRIAGVAVAAVVVSGAGILLSSPTGAVTAPTPITLDATGMSSASCPLLPVSGSIAVAPNTAVQFHPGALSSATTESLTIKPAPNSTDPTSSAAVGVPTAGTAPITFTRATTYALAWQIKTINPLGVAVLVASQTGKLVIDSDATGCKVVVQLPVPSVSASAVPSPITSAINGGLGGVISSANGALGPVNSALPTLPGVPGLPGVPTLPGLPGGNSPGVSPPPGADVPGTIYKPSGPTVADRTVPKGYGTGSGVGGSYVPATGDSIVAGGQQPVSNGQPAGSGSSAAPRVKNGGSPRTVELATSRPRSALSALPTLAVILALLALSGATAFYARTFLLQPAAVPVKAKD
jgi:hypothetical protein